MMKKRIMQLCAMLVCICSFLALPVHAASDQYAIPELDLTISIPTEYDVFTLGMSSNNPLFSDYGTTKADLEAQFIASSIYLDAISPARNEEIVVTMTDSPLPNLNGMGDTTLMTLAAALVNEYTNYGITVTDYDIYHHDQLAFIQIYFHDAEETVYGLQFYTVSNEQAMNITLRSYEGSISDSQENTICTVVDSICLDYEIETTPAAEAAPAFVHTDEDTGMTFTVPEGWRKGAFDEQRDFLNAKFESTEDPGLIITYGNIDLWSELSTSERVGYSRSDFSSDSITKQGVADFFGISKDLVDDVTYNGVHYFKITTKTKQEAMGLKFTVTMTQLFRVENGWGYIFQFGGDESSPYYSDFVSLIKSTKYPEASENPEVSEHPEVSNSNSGGSAVALLTVLVAAIVAAGLIIKKRKAQKTAMETSPTLAVVSQSVVNQKETVFCHMCGAELPISSVFCHKCGAKLRQED